MDEQNLQEVRVKRPHYSDDFKRDAVRLIVEEKYSFAAAARAVGVCDQTMRAWHTKFAPAAAPCG
jgi:transposase